MAEKLILIDTSVLIEYFRKTDKSKSVLYKLVEQNHTLSISAITEYEIFTGAKKEQLHFWNLLLEKFIIYPFDSSTVKAAVLINQSLKVKNKQIDIADLFIAATAVNYKIPIATLNKKHFERVDKLQLL